MSSTTAQFDHPCASRGWAPTPSHLKNRLGLVNDDVSTILRGPATGRTSKMGRKAEKPCDSAVAGPSGQHEATKHDRRHTNN